MKTPQLLQIPAPHGTTPAQEALQGLASQPASIAPKFFYDALGSRLFDAITELPSYYPTRTEAQIFAADGTEMAQALQTHLGKRFAMVDLGAGNCSKASRLFPLLQPTTYVAVDISVDFLRQALLGLQREHPHLDLRGLGMDFSAGFELPVADLHLDDHPRLLFYPGSSIGNFDPAQARQLLADMHAASHGGALLIGVDLVKPVEPLVAAYDDELGVTAAFNLNALLHLNRLIGSDFHLPDWRHVALYNTAQSRIEMHLEARQALTVRWPQGQRPFLAGERIHTENSYKWTVAGFSALLQEAGFRSVQSWRDPQGWFAVCLALA